MHFSYNTPRFLRFHLRTSLTFFTGTFILVFALRQISSAFHSIFNPPRQKLQEVQIHGRWRVLREELGLPPLPDKVLLPALPEYVDIPLAARRYPISAFSRFIKRSGYFETKPRAPPPELFFAQDALEEKSYTLEQFADAFNEAALANEKKEGKHFRKVSSAVSQEKNRRRKSAGGWNKRVEKE